MEQPYKDPHTLVHMREVPLGAYIDEFARQLSGIMEQPPRAPDPLLDENGPVFNEREPFSWQKATWLRP